VAEKGGKKIFLKYIHICHKKVIQCTFNDHDLISNKRCPYLTAKQALSVFNGIQA